MVPEKGVKQEYRGKTGHDQAGHAARRLKQQENSNTADDDIHAGKCAGAQQKLVVEDDMICPASRTGQSEQIIVPWNAFGAGKF